MCVGATVAMGQWGEVLDQDLPRRLHDEIVSDKLLGEDKTIGPRRQEPESPPKQLLSNLLSPARPTALSEVTGVVLVHVEHDNAPACCFQADADKPGVYFVAVVAAGGFSHSEPVKSSERQDPSRQAASASKRDDPDAILCPPSGPLVWSDMNNVEALARQRPRFLLEHAFVERWMN